MGSQCPQLLVWGFRLNLALGPTTPAPSLGACWWVRRWHRLLGAVRRRWWQQDFSPAVDDSQESHVFPG